MNLRLKETVPFYSRIIIGLSSMKEDAEKPGSGTTLILEERKSSYA